ncbi:hypothetical protein QYE76_018607 [Lolium multiflorum]|uniref:RING-type domain-containing protein n=1 Tax=Lolium multiflorum TaxID=4521 RepID=A0AAD8PTM9_LOLMU|nr:hypothetical protein QYE76_018607 [Lolium multiflorum]
MDRASSVGGGGGGMPPPQQMPDAVGLLQRLIPRFVLMRNTMREKIFEYIGRKQTSADWRADWRRSLPELARRLEEILFRKFPTKSQYYSMMLGPVEPHFQYALRFLSAQRTKATRTGNVKADCIFPWYHTGRKRTFWSVYIAHNMGPSSSGAGMVHQNVHMAASMPGEAPAEHVNTLLSLGMNSTHHGSRVSNNNPMITMASPAPVKEVSKEPKFSCPVCMNELVNASSTTCGHIFCQKCIRASIQAQSKCPTCRRTLSLSDFHRVYLPTLD